MSLAVSFSLSLSLSLLSTRDKVTRLDQDESAHLTGEGTGFRRGSAGAPEPLSRVTK